MSVKVTKEESPPDDWSNSSCPPTPKAVEPVLWTREAGDKMGSLLWAETKYMDFDIIIGDRVLPVHKCVLVAKSPVFYAMLTSVGFAETTIKSLIKFQDFDYDTVKTAIEFFYYSSECFGLKSESEISTTIICELMKFGHLYEVQHLICACLHHIKAQKKNFNNSERKAIIKSVFDIGLDDKFINSILSIFGPIERDFDFDMLNYPALGDALLVQDDSFKDLKIIFDDGQKISVHKSILALRSPIFAQSFDKLAENDDNLDQLTIDRIKSTVFEKVIEFFYTGFITDEALEKDPDLFLGLEEFADRFKVEDLVSFCQVKKVLLSSTSADVEDKVTDMEVVKDPSPKADGAELSTSWPWWIYPSEDLGTFLWANSGVKFLEKFRFQILTDQVGGVLHVDRCVLASRSPILATLLSSELTSEGQSGQLKIAEFSFDIVQDAITFCYYCQLFDQSIKIKPSCSWVWNLIKFGHKYGIKHLVEACLHQIKIWRSSYGIDERKFFIKSALDLQGPDDSDQKIVDSILSIFGFGAIEGIVVPHYKYPPLGDALLVQDDSFKDLKIICDDGIELSAHKFILALKSPVFAQIFEKMDTTNDTSTSAGQLKITQFNSIVCANAVQWFYSGFIPSEFGTFDRNQGLFLGLLKFADKYKVEQLASLMLQKIDDDKKRLTQNEIDLCIETATDFRSIKILSFILRILGAYGADQRDFDIEKASKESYWN